MNTAKQKSSTQAPESKENQALVGPSTRKKGIQKSTKKPLIMEAGAIADNKETTEAVAEELKASAKRGKIAKVKVIRDSFSFPEQDYLKISELKKTCLATGVHVKKSEILRAGLHVLSKLNLDELKQAVEEVEKVKTGRPSTSKK